MQSIPVHTILTHENPDLDAMLSVLMLQQFGEPFFPGVATARVSFHSAGALPDGKTARQLEKEGVLAVDLGGGRFDTHPEGVKVDLKKIDRSAADLVAEYLGILQLPEWQGLIEFTRLHDSSGHNLFSRDYCHGMVSIVNILNGLQIINPSESALNLEKGVQILSCIPLYAREPNRKNNFSELLLPFIEKYLETLVPDLQNPPDYLGNFLKWVSNLKKNDPETFPRNKMDDLVTLKAIAVGAYRMGGADKTFLHSILQCCLEAITEKEKRWFEALDDLSKNGLIRLLGSVPIVAIRSSNGLTIKAARFVHKAALVIYQNSDDNAVSISPLHLGPLAGNYLTRLAAKIRIAECIRENTAIDYDNLNSMGKVHGWFLHQSGNILLRGSPKSKNFIPTQLPIELIAQIACSEAISYLDLKEAPSDLPKDLEQAFIRYSLQKFSKLS